MEPIEPLGKRDLNLQRIAARHHLSFHLSDGLDQKIPGLFPQSFQVIPHCCEHEKRDATEEEAEMWRLLCPEDPDELVATTEEVMNSWKYRKGPFTISAKDIVAIRNLDHHHFSPNTRREELLAGFLGEYQDRALIYISRAIPTGFFYEGDPIPELHWQPPVSERVVAPELPLEVVWKLQTELTPFQV